MRLRRNSSSPHSSLSPSTSRKRVVGDAIVTTAATSVSNARPSQRTLRKDRRSDHEDDDDDHSDKDGEVSHGGGGRSLRRGVSASPHCSSSNVAGNKDKSGSRVLRPRSTSGRGLLDGSGFLSDEAEHEKAASRNSGSSRRMDSRKRLRDGRRDRDEDDDDGDRHEVSSELRRSGRNRKLSYACFDPDYMTNDDVIRHRFQQQDAAVDSKSADKGDEDDDDEEEDETEDTEETDDDEEESDATPPRRRSSRSGRRLGRHGGRPESPFYNHVRFSPSAKPGSPRYSSRQLSSRVRLRRVRLHNLGSEDEQSEFNRRYSRDLRSRKKRQEEEGGKTASSSATTKKEESEEDEDGGGDGNEADDNSSSIPARRSTRNHASSSAVAAAATEAAKENGEEEPMEEGHNEKEDDDASSGLRRSKRTPKPMQQPPQEDAEEEDDDESSEEEEEMSSRRQLPKRSRCPVERLTYEPPRGSERIANRRREEEIRNLDQYSSDEEFMGGGGGRAGGRNRYNMRSNRRTISRYDGGSNSVAEKTKRYADKSRRELRHRKKMSSYKDRDTSSSSSSDDLDRADEAAFQRRKRKRMNIERSSMLPVNMNKQDVTRAVFRDRQKAGASLADVSPMELDLKVSFDSVGGCERHVNSLKEMVVLPLIYPELFKKFNIAAPRGVLFYGPPGTGKTLMARALASECSREGKKVAFFMRKGADCLSKWIGESERQLRLLFDQAYLMRPSIIFFDEIDGLAPVRSSRQDQIHSSIVSTLLALMDGLDDRGEIIVVGATNRIENIDPALRRPGRFDRELRFALPTRDARKEILRLHTKTWEPALDDDAVDVLADATVGYCGADLKGLCAEAALGALRRRYPQVYKTSQKLAIDVGRVSVTKADFHKAMKGMVPSGQRIQDQSQAPLPRPVRPLLQGVLSKICSVVDRILTITADSHEPYTPAASSSALLHFRPRMLLRSSPSSNKEGGGSGLTTYLAPAVLHHLERFPCHRLDLPALFSNSTRSPEEAICQIVHEAKRTAPSCLYVPRIDRLWRVMTPTSRDTLLSLLGDVLPSMPLLLLATQGDGGQGDDDSEDDFDAFPSGLFCQDNGEVFQVGCPNAAERKEFFAQVVQAACEPTPEVSAADESEVLEAAPAQDTRELTERESKRLRKREEEVQRELRIFLREVWGKMNREQKFFMFRTPVDTEEVDDYLDFVKEPMDFDKMLSKLDNREYKCATDFLRDVDLIAENAITYNSDLNYETNKILCHRAAALQDFVYALIKAEMDTDFEEECKDIKLRRERLERKERGEPEPEDEAAAAEKKGNDDQQNTETPSSLRRKKPKKRISSWARGESGHKKRPRRIVNGDEEEEENEEEEEGKEKMEEGGKDKEGENGEKASSSSSSAENSLSQSPSTRTTRHNSHHHHQASTSSTSCSTPKATTSGAAAAAASPPPTPASVSMVPLTAGGVRIDQSRLSQVVLVDAVKLTDGFGVERLERLLAEMMTAVSRFREASDRSQLPAELAAIVDERLRKKKGSVSSPQQQSKRHH